MEEPLTGPSALCLPQARRQEASKQPPGSGPTEEVSQGWCRGNLPWPPSPAWPKAPASSCPQAQLTDLLSEQRAKVLRLQAELETSEQVQRDFVRLSQALQVWPAPPPGCTTPGDVSWAQQGQSPVRGPPPPPGLAFFPERLLQTLKLCVSISVLVGSPGPGTRPCWVPFITCPARFLRLPFQDPFLEPGLTAGWGGGATFAHQGLCLPHRPAGAPGADPPGGESGAGAQPLGRGATQGHQGRQGQLRASPTPRGDRLLHCRTRRPTLWSSQDESFSQPGGSGWAFCSQG